MYINSEEVLKALILVWGNVRTIVPPSEMERAEAYIRGEVNNWIHFPLEKYKKAWDVGGVEQPLNPGAWRFYDPLASYHLKSSTFGFADGHADRRKWMDKRTLEFIETNKRNPASHSGMETPSPDNDDLRWLIEHFWSKERALR